MAKFCGKWWQYQDGALCHGHGDGDGGDAFGSSLFIWPFLPLFWSSFRVLGGGADGTVSFPWPFPVLDWLVPFLRPPFLPFPLYEPVPSPPPPFYLFLAFPRSTLESFNKKS